MLGICYGMQLACEALGGRVESAPAREYGRAHCRLVNDDELFAGVPEEIQVWMSHGDQVSQVSGDFQPLAATDTCPIAAVKHRSLPIYGLQFHPEVTHTPLGPQILGNFLKAICNCSGTWKLGDFARETIEAIRDRVGNGPGDLRPVGRGRFVGRGRPAGRGRSARRSPASWSTTACCARTKRSR